MKNDKLVLAAALAPITEGDKAANPHPVSPWRANGLGCWGDNCATEKTPMCALPYEDWQEKFGTGAKARGQKVQVTYTPEKGEPKTVECELRDSLPHRSNCFNLGIALNPGAVKALGLKSLAGVQVSWQWS